MIEQVFVLSLVMVFALVGGVVVLKAVRPRRGYR